MPSSRADFVVVARGCGGAADADPYFAGNRKNPRTGGAKCLRGGLKLPSALRMSFSSRRMLESITLSYRMPRAGRPRPRVFQDG
jgi:hypothetical protein